MTESGHELRDNNDQIVRLIHYLKKQRKEMNFLVEKQESEKTRIATEIERLSFKLSLLTKSLSQRLLARTNYDHTIQEIEGHYSHLVEESGKLLNIVNKQVNELDSIMDKKIGTQSDQTSEEGKNSALGIKISGVSQKHQGDVAEEKKSIKSIRTEDDDPGEMNLEEIEDDMFQRESSYKNIEETESKRSASLPTNNDSKLSQKEEEDVEEEIFTNPSTGSRTTSKISSRLSDKFEEKSRTSKISSKSSNVVQGVSTGSLGSPTFEVQTSSQRSSRNSKNLSITSPNRHNIPDKPERVIDHEVQSYREAYSRQHSYQVPSRPSPKND